MNHTRNKPPRRDERRRARDRKRCPDRLAKKTAPIRGEWGPLCFHRQSKNRYQAVMILRYFQ